MKNPTLKPVLIEIPENDENILRVETHYYEGTPLLSVRRYYKDKSGEWKPTKRGLSLSPAKWPGIIEAVNEVLAQADS